MNAQPDIEFSAALCIEYLHGGRHDELSEYLISIFDKFNTWQVHEVTDDTRVFFDMFMMTFMTCMAYPPYVIERRDIAERFIMHNENISNLAAMSSFKNTDAALRVALRQTNNLVKVLILYSARNTFRLDMKQFFDINAEVASIWYFSFIGWDFGKLADKNALDHLRHHFTATDSRLKPAIYDLQHTYFCVTYAAPEAEARVKRLLNQITRKFYAPNARVLKSRPTPDPKHVVVLSAHWFPAHSVYRTNSKFVEALRGKYKLTLVAMYHDTPPDLSLVDEVIHWRDIRDFSPLKDLDAMVAFYPDVGMSMQSIALANFRLAPIQIMSCGHPVSTFGSEIDYFLSGADIETSETARKYYSERLTLIPGRGVVANGLPYPRDIPEKPAEPVRILLSWASQKVNYDMLWALHRVAERCRSKVEFHFLSGLGLRFLGRPAFLEALQEVLGAERVVAHPHMSQADYFNLIGHMHVAGDSHPFGGFNTVVDPIYKGVPVVGFDGDRAFAMYGPHLLRTLGLDGLVASSVDEYVDIMVRLVDDVAWRSEWEQRIRALNLDATMFAETNGEYFLEVVDHLIANHDRLKGEKSRPPIRIGSPRPAMAR
jgi:predicted O-linked N-acetylglucosamine transferase (SPINDLY family)